jgi:hypothetical protein
MDVPRGDVAGTGPFEGFCVNAADNQGHGRAQKGKWKLHLLTPKIKGHRATMQQTFPAMHGTNPKRVKHGDGIRHLGV